MKVSHPDSDWIPANVSMDFMKKVANAVGAGKATRIVLTLDVNQGMKVSVERHMERGDIEALTFAFDAKDDA